MASGDRGECWCWQDMLMVEVVSGDCNSDRGVCWQDMFMAGVSGALCYIFC